MNGISISLAALLALAVGAQAADDKKAAAPAQPAATASPNSVGDDAKKATKDSEGSGSSSAQANPGRNSFTEGQAKSRIEESGFQNVTGLKKDDNGIWTGQAMKDGKQVSVQLDYQGDVLVRQ
jgi:periplasmic protein CpxP/Spy